MNIKHFIPKSKIPSVFHSLDCHGSPLFEWKQLRDKEEAIGLGSYGLVFVARNNSEKVVIKKL